MLSFANVFLNVKFILIGRLFIATNVCNLHICVMKQLSLSKLLFPLDDDQQSPSSWFGLWRRANLLVQQNKI